MELDVLFGRSGITRECTTLQEKMGIPKALLGAFVMVESSGRPDAIRFEPNYRWLYKPEEFAAQLGHTVDTEIALQKFSYGPCQIMGATARSQGMHQNLLRLLNPEIGVSWSMMFLRHLYDRYDGKWMDAIAAYNQGDNRKYILRDEYKNQKYVDKVLHWARFYGMEI